MNYWSPAEDHGCPQPHSQWFVELWLHTALSLHTGQEKQTVSPLWWKENTEWWGEKKRWKNSWFETNKQTNFTPFVYRQDWWMGLEKWLAQVLPLAWWHGIFSTLPTRKMSAFVSEAWSFLSWMLTTTSTLRNEDYQCTQSLWVPVHTSCKGLIRQAQMAETWLVKMAAPTPACKCCGWEWQIKPGLFSPFIWCSAPCEQFQRHPPLPTVYG